MRSSLSKLRIDEEDEGSDIDHDHEEEDDEPRSSLVFSRASPETIIDIRISNTMPGEEELIKKGYSQLLPDVRSAGFSVQPDTGTFGRGQSLWVWRLKQGTMDGRLKPIVDIQLNSLSVSSVMVMAGYSCLSTQVSSQWIWVKRACSEEEELDAIVDVVVTIGLQKNASDRIWSSPGVGWNRVEGNFGRSMLSLLSSYDAFLWFKPSRARSSEANGSVLSR
jgi:hypothetical protein